MCGWRRSQVVRRCVGVMVAVVGFAGSALVDVGVASVAYADPAAAGTPSVGAVEPTGRQTSRRHGEADLNADGYADLVVAGSVDRPDVNQMSWGVSVIYGGPDGLARPANQLWQDSTFLSGPPARGTVAALVTGDFDGDGCDDLAVGTDQAQLGDDDELLVGEVRIIYGSPQGLIKAGSQVWLPSVVDGAPPDEADGFFGSALAAADFGRDRADDLAIGSSDWGNGRGSVTVLYGSSAGLTQSGAQTWTQDSPGVPGRAVGASGATGLGDQFGTALAAGLLRGGRYAALAIGVPEDGMTKHRDGTGSVNVLYGSADGLTARGAERWSLASPGVKGRAMDSAAFGAKLTIGHFTGRAAADLAVTSNDADYNGRIHILRGSRHGLTSRGDQLWMTRSLCRADRKYFDSQFAWSLTIGDFGRNSANKRFDDLVVGGSGYLGKEDANPWGAALVLFGSAKGLRLRHRQIWRWDSKGVKGDPGGSDGDGYADTVTAGNFGRSRYDDLAVADPYVGVSRDGNGAVSVLYGTSHGLTAKGDQRWTVARLGRTSPRLWAERLTDR